MNEIITTLMLNYIALLWIQYWVFGPWSEGGFQQTEPFPPEAWLPRLTDFADAFPILAGLTIHLGLIFALVAAAIMWFVLERTPLGLRDPAHRRQPAGRRATPGIDIARNIIVVFVISGGARRAGAG